MAEMKMKEIPEDVLIEILSYLPVKSLMRFNGVCKAWRDLFRNPDFITKHHHNRETLGKSNISLLVKHRDHGEDCFSFISSTFNDDGSEMIGIAESIYVPFYGKVLANPVVLGPCNGLLCLVEYGLYGKIALWNPAIRQFKILPWSNKSSAGMGFTYLEEVGFGFDNKNNDYKVIAFVYSFDGERQVYRAELYSLTSESWREIPSGESILPEDDFNFGDSLSNPYSHGVYYWLINCNDVYHANWIMSFDMADEVFEIMQLPDFGVSRLTHLVKFAILDASILVVVYPWLINQGRCFDIWVTNEPRVKESWVKRARIAPISGIKNPVGFWKSGELCFEDSSNMLVLYDSSTQQVKNLRLHCAKHISQVANYMESLVQINGRLEDAHVIVRIRNRNL